MMEDVLKREDINAFVIVAGDRDYMPIVNRVKTMNLFAANENEADVREIYDFGIEGMGHLSPTSIISVQHRVYLRR